MMGVPPIPCVVLFCLSPPSGNYCSSHHCGFAFFFHFIPPPPNHFLHFLSGRIFALFFPPPTNGFPLPFLFKLPCNVLVPSSMLVPFLSHHLCPLNLHFPDFFSMTAVLIPPSFLFAFSSVSIREMLFPLFSSFFILRDAFHFLPTAPLFR